MVRPSNGSDADRARSEVRELRETIVVLRTALEDADASMTSERQRMLADLEAHSEAARSEVAALRVKLEAALLDQRVAVQSALAQSADELAQLRETIEALRAALAEALADAGAQRDELACAFRVERDHLHHPITELRTRLETVDAP